MSLLKTAKMMFGYKVWADEISIASLANLPEQELYKDRSSHFDNILFTMNHIYVVDDIFRAHLTGVQHNYTRRNTDECPTLAQLAAAQKQINDWYLDYLSRLDEKSIEQVISFEYIGGGKGELSVFEIILHLVNHAANHRGHVSEMMFKTDHRLQTHDLSVYLRDAHS